MFYAILVPLSVVLGNVANLLTQIMVPRFLPPAEYTKFLVYWGAGQVLAALLFEWLRFGTLRFSVGADPCVTRLRRQSLRRGYIVVGVGVLLIAAGLLSFGGVWPEALIGGLVAGYAASQGLFDAVQALSRAERDNKRFALASILRSFFGLMLALVIARSTSNGYYVFISIALSYPLAVFCIYMLRFRGFFSPMDYSREEMLFLAKFGVFAALSSIMSTALPAVVRMLAAEFVGLSDSAGVLLAVDLSQKVASVIGLAVNMLVMQRAFRAAEFEDIHSQKTRLAAQMASTTAFVVPAALGFYCLQPFVAQYLVPHLYINVYSECIAGACLAAGVLGFRQFGIDPLFLTVKRPGFAVLGPLVSLVAVSCWVFFLSGQKGGGQLISTGLVFGVSLGTLVSLILLRSVSDFEWPLRDFSVIALGCVVMWGAIRLCSGVTGLGGVGLVGIVGGVSYFSVVFTLNLCGFREEVVRYFISKRNSR